MPRTWRVELGWGLPDRYPPMRSLSVAAALACGGTTSRTTSSWPALVSPVVWASIWRNQARDEAGELGVGIP
jgi:hypothetical protein